MLTVKHCPQGRDFLFCKHIQNDHVMMIPFQPLRHCSLSQNPQPSPELTILIGHSDTALCLLIPL